MTDEKENLAVWALYRFFFFFGLRLYLRLYYGSSHIVALAFALNLQSLGADHLTLGRRGGGGGVISGEQEFFSSNLHM